MLGNCHPLTSIGAGSSYLSTVWVTASALIPCATAVATVGMRASFACSQPQIRLPTSPPTPHVRNNSVIILHISNAAENSVALLIVAAVASLTANSHGTVVASRERKRLCYRVSG